MISYPDPKQPDQKTRIPKGSQPRTNHIHFKIILKNSKIVDDVIRKLMYPHQSMVSPKFDFTREKKLFQEVPEMQMATAREYYDMGLTAEDTYQKPGTPGRKTTQKLFKYWNEDHLEEYDVMQLNERQIIAKKRLQIGLSTLIFKLNYQLSLVESEVEGKRKIHQTKMDNLISSGYKDDVTPFAVNVLVEQLRLKIIQSIKETIDLNTAIEIQPTAYELNDETILNTLKAREEMLRDKVAKFHIKDNRRKSKDDEETDQDNQPNSGKN